MPLQHVTPTRISESEVIVCVAGRVELARLRDAFPASTIVRAARSNAELDAMLRTTGERLRMVVVAPRDHAGAPTAPVIRDLRRRRPAVAVVGYCRASHEYSHDIIALANAGIHEILFRDVTDAGDLLRQTLAKAGQSCGAAAAFEQISPAVPESLRPLVEYCLYYPHLSTSVAVVAGALGVHRKTLVNYAARFGLPSPSVLITWCRLIVAAHLLESRGGSVERVALALEYPSATALRNTLRRHTGYRPSDLRRGGTQRLITAFSGLIAAGVSLT